MKNMRNLAVMLLLVAGAVAANAQTACFTASFN